MEEPVCEEAADVWHRQEGVVFSVYCPCCAVEDTIEAARGRQIAAAGQAVGTVARRRIVSSWTGDMKGISQLMGHQGQSSTEPCPFCRAVLNQTSVAGVPQLPVLPEPWASKDKRAAHIINPPLRGDTDSINVLAGAFQAEAAKHSKALSGAGFQSITHRSMVKFSSPLFGFSGMPVHILLGIGSLLVNKFESLCLEWDFKWSQQAMAEQTALVTNLVGLADHEVELSIEFDEKEQEAKSIDIELSVLLESDPEAKARASKGGSLKASDVAAKKYRERKKAFEAAQAAASAVQTKLSAASRSIETLKTELLNVKRGPFHTGFLDFCSAHGIRRAAYFGGNTFIGPDLNEIFGDRAHVAELAAVLKHARVECPNGKVVGLGSDAQSAEQEELLSAFLECHKLFSRKEPLCEHEIRAFSEHVTDFMCLFARRYPREMPTPKLHVLGFHHRQLLELKGSIGMDTEQGIEAFHPEINYVQNLFKNQRDQVEQLTSIYGHVSVRCAGKRAGRQGEDLRAAKHARSEAAREGHKYKKK